MTSGEVVVLLATALVMGYGWHRDHVQLLARLDSVARWGCQMQNEREDARIEAAPFELGRDEALVERDQARRLVHPSTRPAPVADVIPIRKGDAS